MMEGRGPLESRVVRPHTEQGLASYAYLWFIRAKEAAMFGKILVAVDASEPSDRAASVAAELAGRVVAEIQTGMHGGVARQILDFAKQGGSGSS